jgi:hypothetical protein
VLAGPPSNVYETLQLSILDMVPYSPMEVPAQIEHSAPEGCGSRGAALIPSNDIEALFPVV